MDVAAAAFDHGLKRGVDGGGLVLAGDVAGGGGIAGGEGSPAPPGKRR